jgi:hypothetical protein
VHGSDFTFFKHLQSSNLPVTSKGSYFVPSMFLHVGTVILHLLLLPPLESFTYKGIGFVREQFKNNPHSLHLNSGSIIRAGSAPNVKAPPAPQ